MDYLTWDTSTAGNVCRLEGPRNVERERDLRRGVPFGKDFPKDARMVMSKHHKKNTGLADDIPNDSFHKICSKRLVDFLRAEMLPNVEYLPVAILDHKGKVASADHFIVHLTEPQDVLDVARSKASFSTIIKTDVDEVEQLVLDPKKLDPKVPLFRIAHYRFPVIIEKGLAARIKKEKFVGPTFDALSNWES